MADKDIVTLGQAFKYKDQCSTNSFIIKILTMKQIILISLFAMCRSSDIELNEKCLLDTELYKSEFEKGTDWARLMFDASTKIPDGLLYGNINQLGNFDECLSVQAPEFQGKYCRASMKFTSDYEFKDMKSILTTSENNMMPVKWAFCIPSSCTASEVEHIVELIVTSIAHQELNFTAAVSESDCYTEYDRTHRQIDALAIFTIILLVLLASVITLATIFEHFLPFKSKKSVFAQIFSARGTITKLLSTNRTNGSLDCLHGMRVASVLWIIMGHRFSNEPSGAASNLVYAGEWLTKVSSQLVIGGFLAVDTFFFMSGLLVCYLFMQTPKFNAVQYYVYRYIRLAFPMMMVILFYMSILPLLGIGPMWNEFAAPMAENCRNQWWINALYVHNFVKTQTMCLPQSWYLAVDMQLAWLCPLVLLPLRKWPRLGLSVIVFLVASSCFIPFTITYIKEYPWSFDLVGKVPVEDDGFYKLIYMATFSRATPYLVGILTGYLLFSYKQISLVLPKWVVVIGWLLSCSICLAVVFTLAISYQPEYVYNKVDAAFYAGFHRLGWSLGIAWIVVACVHGYGGYVNSVLSWKLWQPVGRLAYGAYLTQYIIFYCETGALRNPRHISNYNSIHAFLGDLPIIFTMALLLYVAVEGPTMALLQTFVKKASKDASQERLHEVVSTDSNNSDNSVKKY